MSVRIAIVLFERMTALDAIGPYEALQHVPGLDVVFVGLELGEVRTENGMLGLTVDARLEDVPTPDVVLVPGGVGSRALMRDERALAWLRTAHETTRFTTSVCTGALVLGAAGLLDGLTATTHWASLELLGGLGVQPVSQRVVEHLDRRIITAAGVSSGIDMGLRLVELLVDRTAAEAAQLIIEHDPEPPYESGSLARASAEARARAEEYGEQRD